MSSTNVVVAPAEETVKKQRSRRDRRSRRRGNVEPAFVANLTNILNQISKALPTDDGQKEACSKIKELVDQAIKQLGQVKQQRPPTTEKGKSGPSTPTEATSVPSPVKADASTKSKGRSRRRKNIPTRASEVQAGYRIPPHLYNAQQPPFNYWLGGTSSNLPFPIRLTNRQPAMNSEAQRREKEQADIRNDLRNARSAADYEKVLEVAERLGMKFEAQAARLRIAKMAYV